MIQRYYQKRRCGVNLDYQNEDPIISAAGYSAVAPHAKSGLDNAERRRQMIQESKFLGGDMEHKQLVIGLGYAVLQRCIKETITKKKEEEGVETLLLKHNYKGEEEEIQFKTKLEETFIDKFSKITIQRKASFSFQTEWRISLIWKMNMLKSDDPTTSLRSKSNCPTN
ncbi:protein Red [Nephila pilipes]|uniref:Protein Red n=1 Tax=Nephila pilipes TaxID=299642 RepID=A0A8X6UGJ7_NEPPI|nr:protein Red [Nephila pilipes]